MLVLTGCSDDPPGSRRTEVDGRQVFELERPPCDDDGACQESFAIDGSLFGLPDCVDPVAGPALGDLIAVGNEEIALEARSVSGRETDEVVAVRGRDARCPDEDAWHIARALG